MTTMNRILRLSAAVAFAFAGFTAAAPASATSANTDVTDLWWNRNQSGWGMQLVNTGTFVFATLFVYGADGKPTWIFGQLQRTGTNPITFSGPSYVQVGGPYYGGAFDPANVQGGPPRGTMTFVLTTVTTGQLTYSIDGVPVSVSVEREPLTMDNYTGIYLGGLTETVSGCNDPANNARGASPAAIAIAHDGPSASVAITNSKDTCTLTGTYSQLGRMGQVQGTYSCASGEVGTSTAFEMNNNEYMVTARLQVHSTNLGCNGVGEFVGLVPR